MTEEALSRQVEADLALFAYPVQDWVRPVTGPSGSPVHNVTIVGGGQAGLAIAFGLRQERISGVVVLDENPEGME
jgi:NADPH-dependent glutamate synthase beta subunit-like oxidoreductase